VSERNLDLVREGVNAWNERDTGRLLELLDPDVELVPMRARLEGGRYTGHAGMLQMMRDTAEDWEGARVEIEELRDLGDSVLVLGRFQAKGRASGVDLDMPAAWISDLTDGRVTRMRAFPNRDEAIRAAGLEG
jgi:ketosteroid isomerase-like protein